MAARKERGRRRPSARAALLDAAVAEFTNKGYEAATVAGIAARAGVTTGAVYGHFRSKLELLLEAVGLSTVEAFTRRSFAIAGKPAAEVAPALARGLVGAPAGRRDLLLIDAIVLARRDPNVAESYRRVIRAHIDAFERSARAGIDSGRIDPVVPTDELGRLVLALAFGVIALRALEQAPPADATVARLVEQLLQPVNERAGAEERVLARVQSRARAAERSRADLHALIAEAAAGGHSLRRIGEAAGLSHERIRRILAEQALASEMLTEPSDD
ncbi:MAG TPA: helix-turn-helix domain-containing protein [Myxococcota bacterium]|nr:helix-turn-helix domain-containing protein [Myxococcota bacterium]